MSIVKLTKREIENAEKKQKIVEISMNLFNEYGYDKTTIADISHATGMATGSIYNYFGSKAGIVLEIMKEIYQNAAKHVEVELEETSCVGQHILNYYLFLSDEYEKYNHETLKAYTNAQSTDHHLGKQKEYIELVHGQIEKYLYQAVEKELWFPEDSVVETVELIHMVFIGCLMTWIYFPIHDGLRETVENNLRKILNKLKLL